MHTAAAAIGRDLYKLEMIFKMDAKRELLAQNPIYTYKSRSCMWTKKKKQTV